MAIRTELLMLPIPGPVAHRPLLPHDVDVDKACLGKLALVLERTVHGLVCFGVGTEEEIDKADEVAIVWESVVIRENW